MAVAVRTGREIQPGKEGQCDPQGIDLADPTLYVNDDHERVWDVLRRHHPVYWNERPDGPGFWAVTRYADVVRVLKDDAVFISAKGMRLDANPAATAAAAGRMLIVTDAPRHGQVRRTVNKVFTRRMIQRLEGTMRQIVANTLDAVAERAESGEPCEFTEVAARLPVAVICDLLGVPPGDWDFMLAATRAAFGEDGGDPLAQAQAHADILSYYAGMVRERRKQPREDLVTTLTQATVDGKPLTDMEIFLNCDGLISGGNETTRHASVGGLLALMTNPDQWDRLHADPGLLTTAVPEILRFTSPAMHVLRTAVEDATIGETPIRAGQSVTAWLPSANRDPEMFDAPDRFDVGRTPNRHVAFGIGEHYCLGSAMAQTELTVLFGELVRRFRGASPAGDLIRLESNLIRGFRSMPVLLHGR